MNKKTFRTVLITIFVILLLQIIIVRITPYGTLLRLTSFIKTQPEKNLSSIIITDNDFQIIEVKTGLTETSTLWFPQVFIRVKNTTGKDITSHHELKVVYVDTNSNEVINQDDCDISSSVKLFPKDTQRKFKLTTSPNFDITKEKHKREMRHKNIQARLYLDDNLIGNYPVGNKPIYFNKF